MSELLPCPFCGDDALLDTNFGQDWWVQCCNDEDCGATDGKLYKTPGEATAAWNRRASLPAAEDAQGWISVDERLPKVGQEVLVYRPLAHLTQDPHLVIRKYSGRENISPQGVQHGFDCWCHPSHWQALPAAPAMSQDSGKEKQPELICPRCKVDRFKAPCPASTGNCPMVGEAPDSGKEKS